MIGTGLNAFVSWCKKRGIDPIKEVPIYEKTWQKYNAFKKDGLLNGMKKLSETFAQVYLDEMYYIDFYSIEKYGKTRLGNLLFLAKQNGDKKMIRQIVEEIRPIISDLIIKKKVDSYGVIPPSIDRKVQFLTEMER